MRFFLFTILLISIRLFGQPTLVYPTPIQFYQTDTIWGTIVKDPYRWMEKINSVLTNIWLQAEKKLTDEYNQKTFSEMKEYLKKYSYIHFKPLVKQGKYYFSYHIIDAKKTHELYYQEYAETDPLPLFDPYDIDKSASTNIDGFALSANSKTLALILSKNGSDWKTIRFLDMKKHQLLNDTISFVKYTSVYWYKQGLFYVKYNVKNTNESFTGLIKGRTLYYHKLGTRQSEDIVVYKPHSLYKDFDFEVTPEGKYLILYNDTMIDKKNVQRVSQVKLNDSLQFNFKIFISVVPDKHIDFNVLGVLNEKLIVQSTIKAPTGAIFSYYPEYRNKREMLVKPYANQLDFSKMVGNRLLAVYSNDTSSYAIIMDSTGKMLSSLQTPEGYRYNLDRFSYSSSDNILLCSFYSFFSPPTIYKFDLNTFKASALSTTYVQYRTKDYMTRKVYYYSKDSTLIPMYITHKKDFKPDGNSPALLYGYGGFGVSMEPFFSPSNLLFMKNGGVFATPCIRGGGDYPGWHEEGIGLKKQNSFDDFIAAAEYLIANKYTNPNKLAAMGGSNGGLLVGAVMLQKPELFKAVICEAGVLDMLRFHLYNIGYVWRAEYGDIRDSTEFKNLLKYSPVHNVKQDVNYPATLLVASDNDDRVNPFHSFKFMAELQAKGSGTQPYLFYYEKNGGHSGSVTSEKHIETEAYIYAFIFKQLGIEKRIKY